MNYCLFPFAFTFFGLKCLLSPLNAKRLDCSSRATLSMVQVPAKTVSCRAFLPHFRMMMSLHRVVGFLLLKSCLMASENTPALPFPSFFVYC
jgi:hypothetical protein